MLFVASFVLVIEFHLTVQMSYRWAGSESSRHGQRNWHVRPILYRFSWRYQAPNQSQEKGGLCEPAGVCLAAEYFRARLGDTDIILAVIFQTLDPAWNEQFEFTNFRLDDELVVSIYDW